MSEALIGRAAELARIQRFVSGPAEHGGVQLISGEPGVGKTALLGAAAEIARRQGSLVLRAAGVQFEAHIGYSSLHQLLMPRSEEFEGLPGNYHQALVVALGIGDGPSPPQLTLVNAILAVLTRAAGDRTALLVIDDLPWLDRASAIVLSSVARRLRGTRIALLGASRPGPGGFFERAGLPETELQPWTRRRRSTCWPPVSRTWRPRSATACFRNRRAIRWRCWSCRRT